MYRAAKTLAFTVDDDELCGCNFIQKTTFTCSAALLDTLLELTQWSSHDAVAGRLADTGSDDVEGLIETLVACGALLRAGSPEAQREDHFATAWDWQLPAALLHFTVQDNELIAVDALEAQQLAKMEHTPQPALVRRHAPGSDTHAMVPNLDADGVLALMALRRTRREVAQTPLSIQALADCLFAGLGIVGFTRNAAGTLPLRMTPSGGARNPFEAYVLAERVTGLARGLYHYSALDRSLLPLHSDVPERPSALVGDQLWVDDMACVVFLCAHFERTMWKYADPNAYRVILIEAGHIGQNIMLAATDHDLTACPTAALRHQEIAALCDLDDPVLHAPVYALALGAPRADSTDPQIVPVNLPGNPADL